MGLEFFVKQNVFVFYLFCFTSTQASILQMTPGLSPVILWQLSPLEFPFGFVFNRWNACSVGFRSGDWLCHCIAFHFFAQINLKKLKKTSYLEGASQCRWTTTQSILGKQPISSAAVGWIWPDDVAPNTIHPAVCISTYNINKCRGGWHPCVCVLWQYHYNASLVRWNALKLEYFFLISSLCIPLR